MRSLRFFLLLVLLSGVGLCWSQGPWGGVASASELNAATKAEYIDMLKSPSVKQKTDAAKRIERGGVTDDDVLNIVEDVLLEGYMNKPKERFHVDAMSWLCKALGASGNIKYKETLKKVYRETKSRKLKKYAKQSYDIL